MQGKVDTSFQTMQRDMFASGLAAQIGMNAFGIWQAIKAHADFETGEAWPGTRRLAEMAGVSQTTVNSCVEILENAKLLRVLSKGKGKRPSTYIARERMDVRLGERVLCTIVIDYVPLSIRKTIAGIAEAVSEGTEGPEAWADCEIIPGDGFTWDEAAGALKASIRASEVPSLPDEAYPQIPLGPKLLKSIKG